MTQNGLRTKSVFAGCGGLLAAALVVACSSSSPYESTAAQLARAGRGASSVRFSTTWKPLRRDLAETLSADEEAHGRFWLNSCVNELSARFTPAPGGTIRALQIAECMLARGWHLDVREAQIEAAVRSPAPAPRPGPHVPGRKP